MSALWAGLGIGGQLLVILAGSLPVAWILSRPRTAPLTWTLPRHGRWRIPVFTIARTCSLCGAAGRLAEPGDLADLLDGRDLPPHRCDACRKPRRSAGAVR